MNCITIKKPYNFDDSYYFIIPGNDKFGIKMEALNLNYLSAKLKAFEKQDCSKSNFISFHDRPSLRNMHNTPDLKGSIYTVACENKNGMWYNIMIETAKRKKADSRKCVVNMADKFSDYMDSEIDTSCLNIIHYCKNKVTLFFRASDIENELLTDLITIKRYFIDPVYANEAPPEIHVIASTAQRCDYFNRTLAAIQTIDKLRNDRTGYIKL